MAEKATTNVPVVKEPVFSKTDLIESAALFNVSPAMMAGALYNVKSDKITKIEAAKAVESFAKRVIKKGDK